MNQRQALMKLGEDIISQSWTYLYQEWNRFPTKIELKNIIAQFVNKDLIFKCTSIEVKNLFINCIFDFMWDYINSDDIKLLFIVK